MAGYTRLALLVPQSSLRFGTIQPDHRSQPVLPKCVDSARHGVSSQTLAGGWALTQDPGPRTPARPVLCRVRLDAAGGRAVPSRLQE
jgi:hypothetical protein